MAYKKLNLGSRSSHLSQHLSSVLVCLLALWILSAPPLSAQTTSTEILGTVSDQSGAVIAGAKVTMLRVATGEKRETTTNASGDYSFPLVEIGEYTVTAQQQGFKTQEIKNVLVQLQQKARVNFAMEVGEITQTVEVSAALVSLKTDDAAVGQVIDNKRVVELPLNGRNIGSLAVLTPGVQYGQRVGFDGAGGFPIPGNTVAVSANGQREINQQITLDGVIATEPRVNTMVFTPSIDAIEEFKVQTSSYSAEYGQNNGAIVQIAMKSGTNNLHGSAYEFLRNDRFAARDYFLSPTAPKNVLRRNQFGVFVSGPVFKDKTFWSFNYEGRRETREVVQEAFWYPQAFRNGDFSALLTPLVRNGVAVRAPIIIFDPLTGEPFRNSSGAISNIIPADRINKNAQSFINKFQPVPSLSPADILDINQRGSVPNIITSNQFFWRVDHTFGPSDKIFVRHARDRSDWEQQDLNPNFPYFTDSDADNWAFQHVHIFSQRMLNEFRYGLNKAADNTLNPRSNTDFDLDSLGIGQFRVAVDGNRKFNQREAGLPGTIIGGDRDGGNGYDFNTVHQFADNFSFGKGNHNFKTGIEYRRVILDRAAANLPRGSMGLGSNESGYSLASWLMGYPNSTTTAEGFPFTAPRQGRYGAYFLDDWKATRKLTVNIGLRWDYFGLPTDSDGGWRSLRLDILSTAADGRQLPTLIPAPNTKDFAFYKKDNRYFMPRLGLAYRFTDKWVVRSGFGWFANAQQLNNFTILNLLPPRSGTFGFNQVTDAAQSITYAYNGQNYTIPTRRFRAGTQILTLDNAFPGQGTAAARTNLSLMVPNNKASNHVQWSLDIQRELPWNSSLTVGYVGSKTSNLDNSIGNFNNPDPTSNTDLNSLRPYQAFIGQGEGNVARGLGNIRYLDSFGNGSYHGLQTSFEKRYSNGLTMGLAYTYSKSLGEGYGRNEGAGDLSSGYQNPRDRRSARTRYGFDVTHNAVINYVYEMPFLNRFKGVAGAVLAGWQTNGILTFRTGFPFNPGAGTSLNTGGDVYPDRAADGRLGSAATREKWFDPTAFRRVDCNIGRPDLCHYGNTGQGSLVSPGAQNLDLSVYKNWKMGFISEQSRLQFRAEFFNALNTPQFGLPNGIGFADAVSVIPNAARMGEIRRLRLPMRVIQFGMKFYF